MPPTRRMLVVVNSPDDVARSLSVVRAIAIDAGGEVVLLVVLPVPEPVRDRIGRLLISSERQIDQLEPRTLDALRALAVRHFDDVPTTTAVIFGEPEVEIAHAAENSGADLVVFTAEPRRPWRTLVKTLASGLARPIDVIQVRELTASRA